MAVEPVVLTGVAGGTGAVGTRRFAAGSSDVRHCLEHTSGPGGTQGRGLPPPCAQADLENKVRATSSSGYARKTPAWTAPCRRSRRSPRRRARSAPLACDKASSPRAPPLPQRRCFHRRRWEAGPFHLVYS